MRTLVLATIASTLILPATAGCDALLGLIGSNTIVVELVNDGDFSVDGTLYYDDDQEIPELVLPETGTEVNFDIEPGDTFRFTQSCDDLQAIFIEDADLRVALGVSPETDSDVFRDGDDFSCGDTIVFTFTHGAGGIGFDVDFTRVPG